MGADRLPYWPPKLLAFLVTRIKEQPIRSAYLLAHHRRDPVAENLAAAESRRPEPLKKTFPKNAVRKARLCFPVQGGHVFQVGRRPEK